MVKLTDLTESTTHRVLVYGGPKTGKTELVSKLAEHFNILYFGLENGHAVFFKLSPDAQSRVEIINIPDTKVFPIAIETMLKVVSGLPVTICETHGKVNCASCKTAVDAVQTNVNLNSLPPDWIVVIDSLTQLSNSAMNHLTKNEPDTYKVEWTDYRNQGQLLDKFLSQIQQAKYNVICITHEVEAEMENGKKKLVPVAGTREFSRNTAKYFDDVVYCEVKNNKHVFASSTTYSGNVLSGSRTDVVMEIDEAPTLLRIFKPEMFAKVLGAVKAVQVVSNGAVQLSALERLKLKTQNQQAK